MDPKAGMANNSDPGSSMRSRRRRNHDDGKPRFFLAKQGSTLKALELGDEVATEGEALIRALKSDQPFYVVTAFQAVAQENGKGPVIVKQPAS